MDSNQYFQHKVLLMRKTMLLFFK